MTVSAMAFYCALVAIALLPISSAEPCTAQCKDGRISGPSCSVDGSVNLYDHAVGIHQQLDSFLHEKPHSYGDFYSGPWIENYWISTFKPRFEEAKDSAGLRGAFGPYVPLFIPWTDSWVNNKFHYPDGFVARLKELLRDDVLYITVVQSDQGLAGKCELHYMPNVVVLSAGGFGHVAIPLLMGEHKPIASESDKKTMFTFLGNTGSHKVLRRQMCADVQKFALSHQLSNEVCTKLENWEDVLSKSNVGLCPRGFGRTSFRLFETIQLGTVPWYVYDDVEWIPYRKLWNSIGFSSQIEQFPRDLSNWNMSMGELREKRDALLKCTQSHFTYAGVMNQIERFMTKPEDSDLECQQHPECPRTEVCKCSISAELNSRKHFEAPECPENTMCGGILEFVLKQREASTWNRYYADVVRIIEERNYTSIVEIGTAWGGMANAVLASTKQETRFHAVDPFLPAYDDGDDQSNLYKALMVQHHANSSQFSQAYAAAMRSNLNGKYGPRYQLHHDLSTVAVSDFADNSCDIVFVDGLHTEVGVRDDIIAWRPKVKKGGMLIFNDYGGKAERVFPGVTKAVNEFADREGLQIHHMGKSNVNVLL